MEFIIITQNKAVDQVANFVLERIFDGERSMASGFKGVYKSNTLSKLSLSVLRLIIPFFIYSLVCGNCGRQFFWAALQKKPHFIGNQQASTIVKKIRLQRA